MGQQTVPIFKNKFANGKTPTGRDFGDVFDSYVHKSTKIDKTQILGLNDELNDKANKSDFEIFAIGMIYKPCVLLISNNLYDWEKKYLSQMGTL